MKNTEQNPALELDVVALSDEEMKEVGGGGGDSPIEPEPIGHG